VRPECRSGDVSSGRCTLSPDSPRATARWPSYARSRRTLGLGRRCDRSLPCIIHLVEKGLAWYDEAVDVGSEHLAHWGNVLGNAQRRHGTFAQIRHFPTEARVATTRRATRSRSAGAFCPVLASGNADRGSHFLADHNEFLPCDREAPPRLRGRCRQSGCRVSSLVKRVSVGASEMTRKDAGPAGRNSPMTNKKWKRMPFVLERA
jgi:hypothetical protein